MDPTDIAPTRPGQPPTAQTVPSDPFLADLTEIGTGHVKYKFLDPYVLVDTLGRGAMGIVCLAYHRGHHRWAAVKIQNSAHEQRFTLESRSLRRFRSQYLVGIEGNGSKCGISYLAMEFVNGETFAKRLKRRGGQLQVKEAAMLIAAAASGVAHVHRKGGVHRDIKPSNLLVTSEGLVKVADLGIAKLKAGAVGGLTMPGASMGTPGYMAPEQYGGAATVTAAADVFALAVTFLQLVLGHNPIRPPECDEREEGLGQARTLAQNIHVPESLPPALRKVLQQATARDPGLRIRDAASFRKLLLAAVPGLPFDLADPEAAFCTKERLANSAERVRSAIRGLPAWVSPTRTLWRLGLASVALACTAFVITMLRPATAGEAPRSAPPELRIFVDGTPLGDQTETRPLTAGDSLRLQAEVSRAGIPCAWHRLSGPADIILPPGPDITLQVPSLTADAVLTLQARSALPDPSARRTVVVPLRVRPAPPPAPPSTAPEELEHDGLVWRARAGSGTWFDAEQAVAAANRNVTTGPYWRLPALHELAAAAVLADRGQLSRAAAAPYADGDRIWSSHDYVPMNEAKAVEIYPSAKGRDLQTVTVTRSRREIAFFHLVRNAR